MEGVVDEDDRGEQAGKLQPAYSLASIAQIGRRVELRG